MGSTETCVLSECSSCPYVMEVDSLIKASVFHVFRRHIPDEGLLVAGAVQPSGLSRNSHGSIPAPLLNRKSDWKSGIHA